MAGGLSAAQHVCKYDLLILEAFLIDNTIKWERLRQENFYLGCLQYSILNARRCIVKSLLPALSFYFVSTRNHLPSL